jgi:hypothetical protein
VEVEITESARLQKGNLVMQIYHMLTVTHKLGGHSVESLHCLPFEGPEFTAILRELAGNTIVTPL